MRATKQQAPTSTSEGSSPTLIRSSEADDVPIILSLAEGTHVFAPLDIIGLQEDFESYFARKFDPQDRIVTCKHADSIVGFAHYGPAAITQGTWYLYWIVVDRHRQGLGLGSSLLRHVEAGARAEGGRIMLIETSTLARYEPTRRFYLGQGYQQECVIRDYYCDGDDKIIFSKRL